MSEFINNREQLISENTERLSILKQLFVDLHNGRNLDEVKAHFDAFIGKITVDEITQLQHDFVEEGSITAANLSESTSSIQSFFKEQLKKKPIKMEDLKTRQDIQFILLCSKIKNLISC